MVSIFSQEVRFFILGISFRHFCPAWQSPHYAQGILKGSFIAMVRPTVTNPSRKRSFWENALQLFMILEAVPFENDVVTITM